MIQINKRWAIRKSKMAICLSKSIKVQGEVKWIDQYYFSDIPAALDKLVDIAVLKGLDRGSWQAVVDEVKAARAEISNVRTALKGLESEDE